MTNKPKITLFEVLDRFFYKGWIQEELNEVGETTSGSKQELIQRLLDSKWARSRDVNEVANHLISLLPASDLRSIGQFLGLQLPRGTKEIAAIIMNSTEFEPYLRSVRRECAICGKTTSQDLHFGPRWESTYFECRTCKNTTVAKARNEEIAPLHPSTVPEIVLGAEPSVVGSEKHELREPIMGSVLPPILNVVNVQIKEAERTQTLSQQGPGSETFPSDDSTGFETIHDEIRILRKEHMSGLYLGVFIGLAALGASLFGLSYAVNESGLGLFQLGGVFSIVVGFVSLALWFVGRSHDLHREE
jgi:hypothetical protein